MGDYKYIDVIGVLALMVAVVIVTIMVSLGVCVVWGL